MLTANQLILLGRVVTAPYPPSTESLAAVSNEGGRPFGEDAARNCMKRLEARTFVVGSGQGRKKTWAPTPAGIAAHQELSPVEEEEAASPPAEDPDSDPGKAPRRYCVLEQLNLGDAVREALPDDYALPDTFFEALTGKVVYEVVHTPEARNTEHALRQTAKEVYADVSEPPILVPVASKMWRPTPVKLNNRQTVSIG